MNTDKEPAFTKENKQTTTPFSIRKLTNSDLDLNLKKLVVNERELLVELLKHIAEVDRRKLHLTFAYPSLFEYLTKHIGYSNGSAQRRIDAARLANDVVQLGSNLETGQINLSQVTLLQKAIRQVQIESGTKINASTKVELIHELKGKTFSESEIIVSKAFDLQIKTAAKTSHQQDESVRFEVTLTKEQFQKIEQMRQLLSNSLPNGSWDQVLEFLADKVIAKNEKINLKANAINSNKLLKNKSEQMNSINFQHARSAVKKSIQDEIFLRDEVCHYTDKVTNHKCGSKWNLNLDHIKPIWAGGTNDPDNLRVLCANHNRHIYKQQTCTQNL
ncbi:MAG: HNH endonuclease [Bdellovibrio sp.]|nr:HNH endonuclease [Bdellovibrio sp.]